MRVAGVEWRRRCIQLSIASVAMRRMVSCFALILAWIKVVGQAWALLPWMAVAMFDFILLAALRGVPSAAEP